MNCQVCNIELTGQRTKFCSTKCKCKFANNKHQNYKKQQERGAKRKLALIALFGAMCQTCGYNKNHASLCFHHIDESQKTIQLDLRTCSNNSWEILLAESKKCQLLCHNCHMELHYPQCTIT